MSNPLHILRTVFGYEQFRGPQAAIIDQVVGGGDALVIMPTGGGKSLCFQVPALLLPGITLVVSPLISLMKDQVDGLREAGVNAAYLNSSMKPDEQRRVMSDALEGRIKLLYLAPERLAAASAIAFLERLNVSLIAIDEAHCISEWGHDFRPDYRNLSTLRSHFPKASLIALTATATENVRADIARQLGLTKAPLFVSGFDRPNLTYAVVPKKNAFGRLMGLLAEKPQDSTIVYCFSRKAAEELAEKLRDHGVAASAYHAGLSADERAKRQDDFIRDDIRVIAATVAFGMGIDKPDVRLVVHYDMPKSVEGYYQETGRAGRDGLPSRCVMLFSGADRFKHMYFVDRMEDHKEKARVTAALNKMVNLCETSGCRRAVILSHFGENPATPCGGCDNCLPSLRELPVHEPSKKGRKATVWAALQPSTLPTTESEDLFEHLRALRKRLADERRVPAYLIFGDRSLHDMAAKLPKDRDAMATIFGVGEKKLQEFGDVFLKAITEYAKERV